jgi:hypothetical protein
METSQEQLEIRDRQVIASLANYENVTLRLMLGAGSGS